MSLLRKIQASAFARNIKGLYLLAVDGELDLNPPYQRGAVWSLEQKQNLWKSMLMGLPVGSIFLNLRSNHSQYFVVDGQQRIRAILDFFKDELSIPSAWLDAEHLGEGVGEMVTWSELSDVGRRILGNGLSPVSCYESKLKTVEEEAELYLLINFGGVEQTAEDKARATKVAG